MIFFKASAALVHVYDQWMVVKSHKNLFVGVSMKLVCRKKISEYLQIYIHYRLPEPPLRMCLVFCIVGDVSAQGCAWRNKNNSTFLMHV